MRKQNVYDRLKDKFVLGENISQTASFVFSGSADAGIIALSLALSPNMKDKGRYVAVPDGGYPPIEQALALSLAGPRTKRQPSNCLSSRNGCGGRNFFGATVSTCRLSKARNERQSRSTGASATDGFLPLQRYPIASNVRKRKLRVRPPPTLPQCTDRVVF